jgi:hypothetical protein
MPNLDIYPVIQVVVDGNISQDVASVRLQWGGTSRTHQASIQFSRPQPFPINDWSTVQVNVGHSPETAYTRLWGYQLKPSSALSTSALRIECFGPYVKVERGQLWTTDDPHLSAVPVPQGIDLSNPFAEGDPGRTDQQIVEWALDYFGLVAPDWRDAPFGGVGRLLGTQSLYQFWWGEDQELGPVIAKLEEICLGWKTRDTREGRIERVLLPTSPAEDYDLVFTEGVDTIEYTPNRDPLYRYNRFKVSGYNLGREQGLFMLVKDYPGVQPAPGIDFRTMSTSNSMLEAKLTETLDPGVAISCEMYADYLNSVHNRAQELATLSTFRNDLVEEGMTVLVDTRRRLNLAMAYVVDSVTLDAGDNFVQTLSLKDGEPRPIGGPYFAVDPVTGAP